MGSLWLIVSNHLCPNANAEDPVADWNQIAETAVKAAGHAPPVAALDFAIVHLAIYDAVQSVDRRYHPYHRRAPCELARSSAAAAKAGHDVLVGLFPAQSATLDADYANFLAANGIDPRRSRNTGRRRRPQRHILALRVERRAIPS